METRNNRLPPEILELVFKHFANPAPKNEPLNKSKRDLYNCTLVCKSWSQVSMKLLWQFFDISRVKDSMLEGWIGYWYSVKYPNYISQMAFRNKKISLREPWLPYCNYIKKLSCRDIAHNSEPNRAGIFVSARNFIRLLPLCDKLSHLDLADLGQMLFQTDSHTDKEDKIMETAFCLALLFWNTGIRNYLRYLTLPKQHIYYLDLIERLKGQNEMLNQFLDECDVAWENLNHLSFNGHDNVMEILAGDKFFGIGKRTPVLSSLNLAHNSWLVDEHIDEFMQDRCLIGLRDLNISFCPNITQKGVLALVARCPNLKSLNIAQCCRVTPDLIFSLWSESSLKVSSSIERLDFVYSAISDRHLKHMAKHARRLRHLNISSSTSSQLSSEGLMHLLRRRAIRESLQSPSSPKILEHLDMSFCGSILNDRNFVSRLQDYISPLEPSFNNDRVPQKLVISGNQMRKVCAAL